MKTIALCCIVLILVASCRSGTASPFDTRAANRKLLQGRYRDRQNTNIAANTVRAQAATSQSIEEAVNNGGSLRDTRRAGQTGVLTSWAASQNQNTFDFVDRNSGPLNSAFGR